MTGLEKKNTVCSELDYLGLLFEIHTRLSSSIDLEELTANLKSTIQDKFGLAVAIYLQESEKDLVLFASSIAPQLEKKYKVTDSSLLAAQVVHKKQAVYIENALSSPVFPEEVSNEVGVCSALGLPLIDDKKVLGTIVFFQPHFQRTFSSNEVRLYEALAGDLAKALSNALLFEKVKSLAYKDPLTGLKNFQAFQDTLNNLITSESGFSIVIIDLDDVNDFNIFLGYQGTNDLLIRLALVIKSFEEGKVSVFSFGGGVFVLLLLGESINSVKTYFASFQRQTEALSVELRLNKAISFTFASVKYPGDGKTGQELQTNLFKELDKAKRAKKAAKDEKQRRAEKLALVGQLASGFANEIYNPLTVLKGYFQLMRHQGHWSNYQETIYQELERIEKLARDFILLTKPTAIKKKTVNLHELLDTACFVAVSKNAVHKIDVKKEYKAQNPMIFADPAQVLQVLKNLYCNALEAMPQGGIITISTFELPKGLQIEITDNGVGIPPDSLHKIFEPFYTSKEQGAGLGLALVQQIVQAHGWDIEAESYPGRGSKFVITIPR